MAPVQQAGPLLPSPLGLHEEEIPLLQERQRSGKKASHNPQQLTEELFIFAVSCRRAHKTSMVVVLPKGITGAETMLHVGSWPGTPAMSLPFSHGRHRRHNRVASCLPCQRWIHIHAFLLLLWLIHFHGLVLIWCQIHLHGFLSAVCQMDVLAPLVIRRMIAMP